MSGATWTLAAAAGSAFAVSAVLTRWLSAGGPGSARPLDHPNERSLHSVPVPRSGGLAVLAGTAVPLLLAGLLGGAGSELLVLAAAASLVALVSYFDDLGEVSRRLRFSAHVGAAALLLAGGLNWTAFDLPGLGWQFPTVLGVGLTLLFVVWMINLYNFMDGMDGFAGGMSAFGFASLAVLGWSGGEALFTLVAACVAAASAGFLTQNFPPARIFLGDVGSSTLGLIAAGLSLWGANLALFPLWVAWLAFSPFIVDATWTLLRRAINGERVWEAHRSHHYQRLVLAGWGHRKTVLRAYLLMAAAGASAIGAPALAPADQRLLLVGWAIIYGLIHVRVRLVERAPAAGQP